MKKCWTHFNDEVESSLTYFRVFLDLINFAIFCEIFGIFFTCKKRDFFLNLCKYFCKPRNHDFVLQNCRMNILDRFTVMSQ